MVNCYVPECHHRSDSKNRICAFKQFPQDKRLKRKWTQLIRRSDRDPTFSSHVCSCHFVEGDFKKLPSIFPWNEKRKSQVNSRTRSSNNCALLSRSSPREEYSYVHELEDDGDSAPVDSKEVDYSGIDDADIITTADVLPVEKTSSEYENEIKILTEQMLQLKFENGRLKKSNLTLASVVEDPEVCYHYTGLSKEAVHLLCDLLQKVREKYRVNSVKILDLNDQVLVTLIRLRRNLSYRDLAFRCGVSVSVMQQVFTSTLQVLHEVLFKNLMDQIPTREKNQMFIPQCFNACPNVTLVLDCTEIPCDVPQNMEKQKATYSNYKSTNTVKYAVGCAVNGSVIYCSPGYPGCTSDRAIVEHTGLLSHTRSGDMVLVDKGFTIRDLLPPGVSLNIPPFARDPQFTEDQVFQCRSTARSRIHIERINSRLKRFLICQYIPHKLFLSCDMIIQTCCALVNLQSPVMGECSDFFKSLLVSADT